jgi:hypothetical protein
LARVFVTTIGQRFGTIATGKIPFGDRSGQFGCGSHGKAMASFALSSAARKRGCAPARICSSPAPVSTENRHENERMRPQRSIVFQGAWGASPEDHDVHHGDAR